MRSLSRVLRAMPVVLAGAVALGGATQQAGAEVTELRPRKGPSSAGG